MIETLYKRSITGKILEWKIEINNEELYISNGELGNNNEMILTPIKLKILKSDYNSRINKKKKEGYKSLKTLQVSTLVTYEELDKILPIYNTNINASIIPMKCQTYKPDCLNLKNCVIQPKLDGVRAICLFNKVTMGEGMFATTSTKPIFYSREGNEYVIPHLIEEISVLPNTFDLKDIGLKGIIDLVYDGEFYIHSKKLNEIRKHIPMRNQKGTLSVPSENPNKVGYFIFDLAIPELTQDIRLKILKKILTDYISCNIDVNNQLSNNIVYVNNREIYDIEEQLKTSLEYGYEGIIIRQLDGIYAFGQRPKYMRKLKPIYDTECKILDIIDEGWKGNMYVINFILLNDLNDETFTMTPGNTDDSWTNNYKQDIVNNKLKYINKIATIQYRTRSGITNCPHHGTVLTIRDYE